VQGIEKKSKSQLPAARVRSKHTTKITAEDNTVVNTQQNGFTVYLHNKSQEVRVGSKSSKKPA